MHLGEWAHLKLKGGEEIISSGVPGRPLNFPSELSG